MFQINVLIFVSEWKWYRGIKMTPLLLQSCELSVSLKEQVMKKEKWGRTIDFVTRLFNLPLICLETEKLFLGSSKKLNLFHNYYKESYLLLRRICVTC